MDDEWAAAHREAVQNLEAQTAAYLRHIAKMEAENARLRHAVRLAADFLVGHTSPDVTAVEVVRELHAALEREPREP